MEPELKALIDSSEFRTYHGELHSRGFNPFDVLQVADSEIRHSNVLAWLLRPDGTHGIGGLFLREFVKHLTLRHDAASLRRLTGFDDEDNVEIRREDYYEGGYADITIGFRAKKVLLVIENKVVGWSPEAEGQLEGYLKTLGRKYRGRYDYFAGVLLTTSNSPERSGAGRHPSDRSFPLGWDDVRGIIRSLLNGREGGSFSDVHVRAFVERYVDVIEERLIHAGDDLAERLRKDHPRIFERLREQPALPDWVDEPTRAAIRRWIEYFGERPSRLRERVADYLRSKQRVVGVKKSAGRGAWKRDRWLYWEAPSGGTSRIDYCVWCIVCRPRNVTVELWERGGPKNPDKQRIWSFLQDTPIDPPRSERYPMENGVIYCHELLKDSDLDGPFEASVQLLRGRLDEFFLGDGDYERIERYLRCLVFDPQGPLPPGDAEKDAETSS